MIPRLKKNTFCGFCEVRIALRRLEQVELAFVLVAVLVRVSIRT